MHNVDRETDRNTTASAKRANTGLFPAERNDMPKVLIVDDDESIVELLTLYFEKENYEVVTHNEGSQAVERFRATEPDIVILDLMLPGRDGYDICRDIRKSSNVPIIMLTARGDTLDKVVGLELGADDYLQKPFEPKELLARVRAVLRRVTPAVAEGGAVVQDQDEKVEYEGLEINKSQYTVMVDGRSIEMPPKELELFYFLATHPNRVFTREQLLANVWGYDFFGESRTVDVHIKRIREKVESASQNHGWKIHTVWGVGYKFEIDRPAGGSTK